MSKQDKRFAKLLNPAAVLTWPELVSVLKALGFREIEGKGSRVKFDNGDASAMIHLHKPHPGNEVKAYVRRLVIEHLKTAGWIE